MGNPFEPGFLKRLPVSPRKIAILRASRIGDFICATPVFRALRKTLPQAEIAMITLPILRDLVERSPYLDRFIAFPGFPGLAEQFFEAGKAASFFQAMQAEKFDLALQMQGSGVYANPFTLMLGARKTVGFVRPGDPAGLLDGAVPLPGRGHDVHRNLAMADFLGLEPAGDLPEFPLWEEDQRAAQELLAGASPPLIGVHPAARDRTRRWPLERFAGAAEQVRAQVGGTLVILAEAGEAAAAGALAYKAGAPLLNLCGRLGLAALGGVLSRLSVLLTNDTGPAHIAYALGVPTVTIFGGGDLERYRPLQDGPFRTLAYPVPCRPCTYAECPIGYVCLENVEVQEVVEAARQVMGM